jgi:hypothetical protein
MTLQQEFSQGLKKLSQGLTCDEISILDERLFKILMLFGSNLKGQSLSAFERLANQLAEILSSIKEILVSRSEVPDSLMVTLIKLASSVTDSKFTAELSEILKAKLASSSRSKLNEQFLMLFNEGILARRIEDKFDFRQPTIASAIVSSKMDTKSLEYYQLAKYLLNVEKENFGNWLPMVRYLIDDDKYDLANQWFVN